MGSTAGNNGELVRCLNGQWESLMGSVASGVGGTGPGQPPQEPAPKSCVGPALQFAASAGTDLALVIGVGEVLKPATASARLGAGTGAKGLFGLLRAIASLDVLSKRAFARLWVAGAEMATQGGVAVGGSAAMLYYNVAQDYNKYAAGPLAQLVSNLDWRDVAPFVSTWRAHGDYTQCLDAGLQ